MRWGSRRAWSCRRTDPAVSVPRMLVVALAVVAEARGDNDPAVVAALLAEPMPDAWHREGLALAIDVYRWQARTFGPGTLQRQGLHLARRSCGLDVDT